MTWYRKAADRGYATAQYNIGWLHEHGLGVKQDYAQTRWWYLKAAEQGHQSVKTGLNWLAGK
jgi:hypothetical protein